MKEIEIIEKYEQKLGMRFSTKTWRILSVAIWTTGFIGIVILIFKEFNLKESIIALKIGIATIWIITTYVVYIEEIYKFSRRYLRKCTMEEYHKLRDEQRNRNKRIKFIR